MYMNVDLCWNTPSYTPVELREYAELKKMFQINI